MKQSELRTCSCCGRGVMHPNEEGEIFGNAITFYRMNVEYFIIDVNAVRRQHGLEMFFGNHVLANVMGPNEDMAVKVGAYDLTICMQCMMSRCGSIPGLLEAKGVESDG